MEAFIEKYALSPEQVDAPACLERLLEEMALGLEGKGNIPMIPSYLPMEIPNVTGKRCTVLDAGGTNLRVAQAEMDAKGNCRLGHVYMTRMPGSRETLGASEFYARLASCVEHPEKAGKVGFCFSYDVELNRSLDGTLTRWSKEIRVPEAIGKPVGASLREALGAGCESVRVLNDSTAALLGAHHCRKEITVGMILGTGVNICYAEPCRNIPKLPGDLRRGRVIISTEIGEFDGFPKTRFDRAVIDASDTPRYYRGEKQCAGAYLGENIRLAWQQAILEGLLPPDFPLTADLAVLSAYLAGEGVLPQSSVARGIARAIVHRGAKLAAVMAAGGIVRSCPQGETCGMVMEGSTYYKLTDFAPCFRRELAALLEPRGISVTIHRVENSCLIGAALAAFAEEM